MTTLIDVAELGPKLEELVDDLSRNGGEISLTRGGETVVKLVCVENVRKSDSAPLEGRVLSTTDGG